MIGYRILLVVLVLCSSANASMPGEAAGDRDQVIAELNRLEALWSRSLPAVETELDCQVIHSDNPTNVVRRKRYRSLFTESRFYFIYDHLPTGSDASRYVNRVAYDGNFLHIYPTQHNTAGEREPICAEKLQASGSSLDVIDQHPFHSDYYTDLRHVGLALAPFGLLTRGHAKGNLVSALKARFDTPEFSGEVINHDDGTRVLRIFPVAGTKATYPRLVSLCEYISDSSTGMPRRLTLKAAESPELFDSTEHSVSIDVETTWQSVGANSWLPREVHLRKMVDAELNHEEKLTVSVLRKFSGEPGIEEFQWKNLEVPLGQCFTADQDSPILRWDGAAFVGGRLRAEAANAAYDSHPANTGRLWFYGNLFLAVAVLTGVVVLRWRQTRG